MSRHSTECSTNFETLVVGGGETTAAYKGYCHNGRLCSHSIETHRPRRSHKQSGTVTPAPVCLQQFQYRHQASALCFYKKADRQKENLCLRRHVNANSLGQSVSCSQRLICSSEARTSHATALSPRWIRLLTGQVALHLAPWRHTCLLSRRDSSG